MESFHFCDENIKVSCFCSRGDILLRRLLCLQKGGKMSFVIDLQTEGVWTSINFKPLQSPSVNLYVLMIDSTVLCKNTAQTRARGNKANRGCGLS